MSYFLRLLSICVLFFPLTSGFGVQFNVDSLGSGLPGVVSSGSTPSGDVASDNDPSGDVGGSGPVPGGIGSIGSPLTGSGNENDGESPPSFSGNSVVLQGAVRNSRKLAIAKNVTTIQQRLGNMTKYLTDAGVFFPVEEEEAEEEEVAVGDFRPPSKAKMSNEQMLADIQARINALQEAIDNYQPPVSPGAGGTGGGEGGGEETPFVDSFTEGNQTRFSDRQWVGYLTSSKPDAGSGIAHSRIHPDILYLVNDSGDKHLYVIDSTNGNYLNRIDIEGDLSTCEDYEDLSMGPCPGTGESCIYIADTGLQPKNILIFPEPAYPTYDDDIYVKWKYQVYHSKSIEAMFVTNFGDVYLLTEETHADLIRISSETGDSNTWEDCAYIKSGYGSAPTAADISDDGTIVLVKTEDSVVLFHVPAADNYHEILCDDSQQHELWYITEYDGQSISFMPGSFSYLTLSEAEYSAVWRYDKLKLSEVNIP